MENDGMEWNGMEWNGMEWNDNEWNGMDDLTDHLTTGRRLPVACWPLEQSDRQPGHK